MFTTISRLINKMIPSSGVAPDAYDSTTDILFGMLPQTRSLFERNTRILDRGFEHSIVIRGAPGAPKVYTVSHGHLLYAEVALHLSMLDKRVIANPRYDATRRMWTYGFTLFYKEKLIHPTDMLPLTAYNVPFHAQLNIRFNRMLGGGFLEFLGKRPNREQRVHCGLVEPLQLRVQYLNHVRSIVAMLDTDVYELVDGWLQSWSLAQKVRTVKWRPSYSVMCGVKPLRRVGIPLKEYGVQSGMTLNLQFHLGLGGAVMLPPYTHVQQCEDQLLNEVIPQGCFDIPSALSQSIDRFLMPRILRFNNFVEKNPKEIQSFTCKLLEDTIIFASLILDAKTKRQYFRAIITFVKLRDPRPLMETTIVSSITAYFEEMFCSSYDNVAQSFEEVIGGCRSFVEKFSELRKAPIFTKLYKLLMYAMSFSLFDGMGITFDRLRYTKIEAEAIKRKHHMGLDFIECMSDSLLFIVERGYQCMKTGTLDPIYHSGSTYEKWYDQATLLKQRSNFLAFPEAHGFTMFEYFADLKDCLEKGQAIHKHAVRIGEYEKRLIKSLLSDLAMIQANNLTKREAQKERDAPFAVLLYGGSSVGKSTLTKMLYYQYGKTFGLPLDSEYKYTHNANANFWDGFNSTQWCVQLDDIAFMHPNQASGGDPTVMEMLQVVNNVPFVPDQASLDDKGRTPMRAKFVIATTNCENLNAVHYFQTPLAAQRRLPFVLDVQPKPEFAKYATMLDSSRVVHEDGRWPNYWNISVKKVVPASEKREGQRAKYELVQNFTDIDEFLSWFSIQALEHDRIQKLVNTCDQNMKKLDLCRLCWKVVTVCTCATPQSEETEEEQEHYTNMGYLFKRWILLWCIRRSLTWTLMRYIVNNEWFMAWFLGLSPPRELREKTERQTLRDLGERVHRSIGKHQIAIAISVALTGSAFAAYKLYKLYAVIDGNEQSTPQEEVQVEPEDFVPTKNYVPEVPSKTGRTPKPLGDEKPNVWYNDSFELSSFEMSAESQSWNTMSKEDMVKRLGRNVVHITVRRTVDGRRLAMPCNAICLTGHYYMANNHCVPEGDLEVTMVFGPAQEGVQCKTVFLLSPSEIRRFPHEDVCVFRVRSVPPKKDIRAFFPKDSFRGRHSAILCTRTASGQLQAKAEFNVERSQACYVAGSLLTSNSWTGTAKPITEVGDCGSLVFATTPQGPVILGIHAFSNAAMPSKAGTTTISELTQQNLLVHFEEPIVQSGVPTLSGETAPRTLGALHHKSVFRYIEDGKAIVYGSFEGFSPRPRSHVVHTLMHDAVLEEGYTLNHGPPVMASYEPWRIAALDMTKPVTHMKLDVLKTCVEAFKADILANLPPHMWEEIMVYDDFTTMNGAAGVAFVDKMNRNTSVGNPYKRGKKHYLEVIPPRGGITDPVQFTKEIRDRITVIEEKYAKGERVHANFCNHLKDDPTTFKKIEAKKTRLFAGAPADWCFVVRKYLLSVVRVMQLNKFVFECGPGTNATSPQWGEIRDFLTTFGEDRMIAGDYGSFDKTMSSEVILAAYDILRWMCKTAGYSEQELLVVQGIAEDTAFPLMEFNGDLVEFMGSNPSGHPLTVIVNGLANSLYFRYCYHELNPDSEVDTFRKNVRLMTYGDDNVAGVHERAEWFNHTAIVNVLADVGIRYTMADKESASVPFININEVSFLKRTWRWDDEVKSYMAPLEEASIEKSLLVSLKSKTLTPEAHAIAVMSSAHREYFHYGRTIFEQKVEMFARIIEKCELRDYVRESDFPTWDELYVQYWS